MDDDLLEQLRTRHIKLGYELPTESLFSAAADELERLNAENARLREALEKIAALDVPPSVMTRYRADEQSPKNDICPHLLAMSEDCPDCVADYARAVLARQEPKA